MTQAVPFVNFSNEEIAAVVKSLQEFCRNNTDYAEQLAKIGVATKQVDGFHMFDYEMIGTDWTHPYPWICRGLVLNSDFDLVCFGLMKFWNDGESNAQQLDGPLTFFTKLDGTCLNRWWSEQEQTWRYSTRYNMGPGLVTKMHPMSSMTWDKLIEQAFANIVVDQPKHETWTFELCSQYNQIVVDYPEPKVWLLAIRDLNTMAERDIAQYEIACPTNDIDSIVNAGQYVQNYSGLKFEGVVVRDQNFKRLKIKNPQYVWYHHMRSSTSSWKSMVNLIRTGNLEEFCVSFPNYSEMAKSVGELIEANIEQMNQLDMEIQQKNFANPKDLALWLNNIECSFSLYFFNKFRGKEKRTFKEFVFGLDESKFLNWAESIGCKKQLDNYSL